MKRNLLIGVLLFVTATGWSQDKVATFYNSLEYTVHFHPRFWGHKMTKQKLDKEFTQYSQILFYNLNEDNMEEVLNLFESNKRII